MRKHWPWAVVVLVLLLLWHSHNRDVAEKAVLVERTKVAEAVRDSALALLPPLEARAVHDAAEAVRARQALDSVQRSADRRIRQAQATERVAVQRAVEAGRSVDASVDSVRVLAPVLGDSLRAQVAEERAATATVAQALREQNGALASTLGSLREFATSETRRADANSALADGIRQALAAETAVSETWERRALASEHVGILERARRAVVPLAVGVLAGVLLRP